MARKRLERLRDDDWRPDGPYFKLIEFKQWWPAFENFKSFYFPPQNCPPPFSDRFGTWQYIGRWGMFTEAYRGGFGRLFVGEINVKADAPVEVLIERHQKHRESVQHHPRSRRLER